MEDKKIIDIITEYKDSVQLFNKYEIIKDIELFKKIGSNLLLKDVLKAKNIDVETFINELNSIISPKKGLIKVRGILPCPVKNVITDYLSPFYEDEDFDIVLDPASIGTKKIEEQINSCGYSDITISAGFDTLFELDKEVKFKDYASEINFSKPFNQLKDDLNIYHIFSCVPAVFLVDKNSEDYPKSWEEIISEKYVDQVSFPKRDLDFFNAVLLNIYKKFGIEGVRGLKNNISENLHPSQMVSLRNKQKSSINIIPYFFATMAKSNSKIVWPTDGAIISPVFVLAKETDNKKVIDLYKAITSKELNQKISSLGRFPATNEEVKNDMVGDNYMWLGFDFIRNNNINELISTLRKEFNL